MSDENIPVYLGDFGDPRCHRIGKAEKLNGNLIEIQIDDDAVELFRQYDTNHISIIAIPKKGE